MLIPVLVIYLSFTFLTLIANNFSFSQGQTKFILISQYVLIGKKKSLSKRGVISAVQHIQQRVKCHPATKKQNFVHENFQYFLKHILKICNETLALLIVNLVQFNTLLCTPKFFLVFLSLISLTSMLFNGIHNGQEQGGLL